MKAVLISIQPRWCKIIASGRKTVEIRKTKPQLKPPFKCYIYCTKAKEKFIHGGIVETLNDLFCMPNGEIKYGYSGELMCSDEPYCEDNFLNGKVIGEFVCTEITEFESEFWDDETYERIKKIIKDSECYAEYGEYEYETVATNEDDKYKENWLCKQSCVSWEEMRKYVGTGIKEFYGWHISDLVIYDNPKSLSEFIKPCVNDLYCEVCAMYSEFKEKCYNGALQIKRPPQSWCYVDHPTEKGGGEE